MAQPSSSSSESQPLLEHNIDEQRTLPPTPTGSKLPYLPGRAIIHMVEAEGQVSQALKSLWDEFKDFINKGNVLDLAVGIIMGAAFSKVVNSLVEDILLPPMGLLVGSNFEHKFWVLQYGQSKKTTTTSSSPLADNPVLSAVFAAHQVYHTIEQAQDDGAITLNYGRFIQYSVKFLVVSAVLYLVIRGALLFRRIPIVGS
ncbi:hypothetical protein IWQ62_005413 [Dispira parvispora]|uniref:Large-conductance mechanosensitive channel n=1 Tax=Dispira parvispora TaxID=1520584 RepID=A0A9W8DZP2_9FUNG|nr:hypothetical protein IWQ62_005413 [Dispira parvispora]